MNFNESPTSKQVSMSKVAKTRVPGDPALDMKTPLTPVQTIALLFVMLRISGYQDTLNVEVDSFAIFQNGVAF